MCNDTHKGRIALITGGNKGIGLETARQLGKVGMTVLLAARNKELGEAAAATLRDEGSNVIAIELDVTKPETITAAASQIEEQFGCLDVLINNAGIADQQDGSPGVASVDSVRRIFETNFFGVLAVTQAMLPLVKKSDAGRIVNVSSGLGSMAFNADPEWSFAPVKLMGYNGSKVALNMLTVQLAYELRDTPIKVNATNPGYTATDLNGHAGHQTVEEGALVEVQMALLPADGPTGGFFSSNGSEPW
ncbi:MAG: SDR family oxidoreductase [Rhizobiaceae bacterium]|nr:SDR family oxidoreductase [Rhizobiaceae bacterium]